MPLYEYQCDACGDRFEKIRKFSDPPVEVCPKCGGTVHKLISAPAFQLKGTGWYATDYPKKDSGAKDAKDEKAGTSEKKDATSEKSSSTSDAAGAASSGSASTGSTTAGPGASSSTSSSIKTAGSTGSTPSKESKTDRT